MLEFLLRIVGFGVAVGAGLWLVFFVWDSIANYGLSNEPPSGLANDGDDWAPFPAIKSAEPSKPDPGEGWRLAWCDEWGDERCEHWNCDKKLWEPRKNVGMLFDIGGYYRIPDAKPTPKRPDIEQQVCLDILDRQRLGITKYGTSVADNPLELRQWLTHSYEEKLDDAIYTKRAMAELDEKMKPYFAVIEAATQVVQKASIGDQNFIPCLQGNDQPTRVLRHMLVKLADALEEV